MTDRKRPRGRPVKCPLPNAISDTPENIMKAFLKYASARAPRLAIR